MNTVELRLLNKYYSMRISFRILLVLLAVIALIPGTSWAVDITLGWDANTETDLAGYIIHYGRVKLVNIFIQPKINIIDSHHQEFPIIFVWIKQGRYRDLLFCFKMELNKILTFQIFYIRSERSRSDFRSAWAT